MRQRIVRLFLLCGFVLVAVAGFSILRPRSHTESSTAPDVVDSRTLPVAQAPTMGPPDAWVTIVEFDDPTWVPCQRWQVIKQLLTRYPADVRFAFHGMSRSTDTEAAAGALAIAAAHGKYAAVRDEICLESVHRAPSQQQLEGFLAGAGVDPAEFREQVGTPALARGTRAALGLAGVHGITPGKRYWVNGRPLPEAIPIWRFEAAIEEELGRARASGVPRRVAYAEMTKDLKGGSAGGYEDEPPKGGTPPVNGSAHAHDLVEPPPILNVPVGSSPSRGPQDALVTIVEFVDPSCALCSRFRTPLAEFGNVVRLVIKLAPPTVGADSPSVAALAAERQGKFWEMLDGLFDATDAGPLERDRVEAIARQLGLDMGRFVRDWSDAALARRVREDEALATRLGVGFTPTLFVNGRVVKKRDPIELRIVVEEELLKAERVAREQHVPAEKMYDHIVRGGAPQAARVYDVRAAPDAPFLGRADAPVVFETFSSFKCPPCAEMARSLARLARDRKDVKVVFRHAKHSSPEARLAAEATVEAHRQGKFWALHDALFQHYAFLEKSDIEQSARLVGMDVAALSSALETSKHASIVDADLAAFEETGLRAGMPKLFVNGFYFEGLLSYQQLVERAEIALLMSKQVRSASAVVR